MKIRRARPEDALIIAQINVETWQDAYKGLIDDDILKTRKVDEKRISGWLKNIENPNCVVLVCEDGGLKGYLSAGAARDDFGIEHEIYALYVKPSAQRKGVGTELIKGYRKTIKNESFYLYMLKNNFKAARFYEKNGGVICEKFNRTLNVDNQTIDEVCWVFEQ